MPIFSSNIRFSKSFAFTATIVFAPDSSFSIVLDPVSGYLTDTQVVFATLHLINDWPTSIFLANYIPPKTGIIYFTFSNLVTNISSFYISPRTGTLAKTLLNATTIISAHRTYSYLATISSTLANTTSAFPSKFFYGLATITPSLENLVGLFDAKLLFFTGPLTANLDLISTVFIGKFYYFSGTWSSTFINTASNILAGVARMVTFSPTLASINTTITLKTPIRIFVTIAIITNYVVKNVFSGVMWPTGTYASNLGTFTASIKGVLPIPISGTLSTNTMALQNPPFFQVFNVPAGNLIKTLANTTVAFSLKVPIRIYATIAQTFLNLTTLFKCRAFIGGTFTKTLLTVSLGWFLRSEFPRQGVLSTYLPIYGLIYAKTSNHGDLSKLLTNVTSAIYLKTPIRISVNFTPTFSSVTGVIRAKSTIGGVLNLNTGSVSPILRILVLIGGVITTLTVNTSSLLTIKVPIPISGILSAYTPLPITGYITGRGHYRPILNSTLSSISVSFPIRFLGVRGVLALTNFTGPTFSARPSYDGIIGELYPYRRGKFWRLLIYSNNGDASLTTFSKIGLFSPQADGTVIDVLDGISEAENFSASNAEYTQPNGMLWSYTLPTSVEIHYYTVKGI